MTDANGSDLWPIAWSDDGHQYTAWGDGTGFDGSDRVGGGAARLEGGPTSFSAAELDSWSPGGGGPYPDSFLSLDGILYLMVNNNSGADELWRSTDKAASWTTDVISFDQGSEIIPTFLIPMGQDQSDAVDEFVYITAVEWGATDVGPFLMRVPEDDIESKAAYEVFTGTPSNPSWSNDISLDGPGVRIHDWPGQISYLPPLDKWLLLESGSGYGAESGSNRLDMGILNVYSADEPYGPWTKIFDAQGDWCGWSGQSSSWVLGKFVAPAWIGSVSNNQLDFWITFSGSDTWDRFNTIKGTLTVD